MKLLTGLVVPAGLVLAAAAANAQVLPPYSIEGPRYAAASGTRGPYAGMRQEPGLRYGPILLPAQEVYTVVRENGFSALGAPQRRGLVYTIAVIDRAGEDGRLVVDARTGRIVRFVPAFGLSDNVKEAVTTTYGPFGPPPIRRTRAGSQPSAAPELASSTAATRVSEPSGQPGGGDVKPAATKPISAQSQQSAVVVQAKPVESQALPPQTGTPAVSEPKPRLLPTQQMPEAQGLD